MKNLWKCSIAVFSMILFLTACGGENDETGSESSAEEMDSNSEEEGGDASEEGYNGESYEWTIGFNTPEDSVRDVAAERFKEIVEEETNGNVTVNIQPAESLGSEQEMLEQIQTGALDFQLAGGGSMQNIIPEYAVLQLPFMVENFDEAYAVLDGPIGDELKSLAEEADYKILSHTDLGFAQITNNVRPINEPSDLEGIQIRSPEEPTSISTFEQLGASTTTMAFTEVYLGLQQGVIDGQFNPLDAIYENNFHEVQDYLAMTNHFYYHVNFIMNLPLWKELDPELQEVVQTAAEEARDASREFTQEVDEEMRSTLEGEFEEITEPDMQPFKEAIDYSEFSETVDQDFINKTQDFIEEYREEN
ncbi:TRAP transporter substrate-binding protein [Salibacterium aidingense]|uniref:TRAP transporter substrate-binding protein n=1 Tax=Salibacterium aidingense TaxID=384933 RepID=UPI003BD8D54B